MLQSIDLQEAQRGSWDVLVVGSSFSAMFFLKGLDPKLRVLIVERGAVVDHEKQVGIGGVRPEEFDIHNTSGHPKKWVARTLFGGNSNGIDRSRKERFFTDVRNCKPTARRQCKGG